MSDVCFMLPSAEAAYILAGRIPSMFLVLSHPFHLASSAVQMTPLPGEDPDRAYHDAVNVVPTRARAIAALLRETSDRASGSCAAPSTP